MRQVKLLGFLICLLILPASTCWSQNVRVKDLGRFLGWRENALVGYGIVTGLSGSGDSQSSSVTQEALKNVLSRMGANVSADEVRSRNVAIVMVTAVLPASAHLGDKIDITVTSIGDARSLVGGTLLMTPLSGPDQRVYALAQGQLIVGGYRFDAQLNRQQKNYPTSGIIAGGATIEQSVSANLLDENGKLTFILKNPDVTTSERIKDGVNSACACAAAFVIDAATVGIDPQKTSGADIFSFISRIENVVVTPDARAVIVVNERSGTIIAGGDVQISSVVISQGDIKISVSQDNDALQPYYMQGGDWRGLVVTSQKLEATQGEDAVIRFPNTTVADLVLALTKVHVDTRGIITILQALESAGALHADIIVN